MPVILALAALALFWAVALGGCALLDRWARHDATRGTLGDLDNARHQKSGLGLLPSWRLDPGLREGRDSAEPPSGGLAPPSVPDGAAAVNGAHSNPARWPQRFRRHADRVERSLLRSTHEPNGARTTP